MFAFGCWAGIIMFLHEKGACQHDMKTVSLPVVPHKAVAEVSE